MCTLVRDKYCTHIFFPLFSLLPFRGHHQKRYGYRQAQMEFERRRAAAAKKAEAEERKRKKQERKEAAEVPLEHEQVQF